MKKYCLRISKQIKTIKMFHGDMFMNGYKNNRPLDFC